MGNIITQIYHYYTDRKENKERIITREMSFEKERGTWYAVIPEWLGPKSALAMVAGADTLLDELSGNKYYITLEVSNNESKYSEWLLSQSDVYKATLIEDNGTYAVNLDTEHGMKYRTFWLCSVTNFVFGKYPESIYFRIKFK